MLFFEQADGGSGSPSAPAREYAILTTGLTSTLQKELSEHAGQGFRLVDAGAAYLLAVMVRVGDTVAPAAEYRLLAMILVKTGIRELSAAGADGFRLRAVSENGNEAVFIMERAPGGPARLEYEQVSLEEATAGDVLLKAESEGYGIARLLHGPQVARKYTEPTYRSDRRGPTVRRWTAVWSARACL